MKKSLLILIVLAVGSCTAPKEKIPDTMPEAVGEGNKLIVYQLMTRLFGNTVATNKTYGTIEENGVGKFNDINDAALKSLKDLGATHIWYTGVLEHALLTDYSAHGIPLDDADVVKGRAGSPYAIKDYYDVNPDLAVDVKNRMREFEDLIARTHKNELAVIIDFVANHVARAYHSDARPDSVKDLGEEDDKATAFKTDNNFYYLPGQAFKAPKDYNALGAMAFASKNKAFEENPAKITGNGQLNASPSMNDWFETVKLNYGIDLFDNNKTYFDSIPDTWVKMRDILIFWAKKNVDGFRCDMAEMVPVEFWNWAIPQVKAINSEIIFVAEIYNPAQYRNYIDQGQFDFLYDKVQLYDTLRLLINQQSATPAVPQIQESLKGINHRMIHFLENHDEQRIASSFFAGDPWKALPAMVVSATIDRGPVMIYFGQEVGEPGAGEEGFNGADGRTTHFDYWGVPEHQKWVNGKKYDGGLLSDDQKALRQFYGDILNFAKSNPAITSGEYVDLTAPNVEEGKFSDRYVAYGRVSGEERLVIVAGFNEKLERIKVKLTSEAVAQFRLDPTIDYVGRDLLRSGADIGLDNNFEFEIDVPPYSAYIFKIK
jgi:glycosidase